MGHRVTLYDREDKIGGQFNMAKRIPGKEEFHETLRYFESMIVKHGVDLRLNHNVTVDSMTSSDTDKWILATGVTPRDPNIPGQDHPNVLSYLDVLRDKKPVGRRVAIIGAGGIGFDVAEYILHWDGKDISSADVSREDFWREWGIDETLEHRGGIRDPEKHSPGREIFLLQRKKGKLGSGLGKTTGWIHRASLKNSGKVDMLDGVSYDKIDENGHLHVTQGGKQRILEVDNIIICAGQIERRDLEDQSTGRIKKNLYTIGGAFRAGELDAKRAMDMGTRLALQIHKDSVTPGNHVFADKPGIEEKLFQLLKRFR